MTSATPPGEALNDDTPCLCCCRARGEHERGQCPETTYFIPNTRAAPEKVTDGEAVGEEDPCPNGSHCCCCGPGDTCCDCGVVLLDIDKSVALERWTDFLDANPDDLTSPEDLPDHALVIFEQFYEMARSILPSISAAPSAPTPANLGDALGSLDIACQLIQEAKGAEGDQAYVTNHLDDAENWIGKAADLFTLYREGKSA